MKQTILHPLLILLFIALNFASETFAATFCDRPLSADKIKTIFTQNAFKQLALEFGEKHLKVYSVQQFPVGVDMVRVEAYAKYKKPGEKEPSTMRVQAWVSVCQGTTVIRGNTWLADGNLIVPRYNKGDLPGKGVVLGNEKAGIRLIVFVDSRCPHCHRLLNYAQALVADGKIYLEIRQVAVLESIEEAMKDTRLVDTALVNPNQASVNTQDYLEMLSGLNSEAELDKSDPSYIQAKELLMLNTHTAQNILHINNVPGVLISEPHKDGQYRLMSYWEMNRLFQPEL